MNFHILFCSSRHVTIELDEDAIYETASYEIWVNGRLKGVFHRMIQTIDGLLPDTDYEIMLVRANEASETVTFHTEPEPITLNVRDFGAFGDGVHDDTSAIQAAILCCPKNARVLIPKGTYPVTALFLKSDMILELQENAVLAGIYDRARTPILPGQIEYDNEDGYYNLGSWEGKSY